MSFKEAAIKVLEKSKKPLHSKEITRIALKKRLIKSKGITPEFTMNAQLLADMETNGRKSKFIQVGPSVFGLRLKHKKSKRTKTRKSTKGALIKGMSKNLPSDILIDPIFKKKLRELLRGYAGIYALYKGERLYYVGLARSLHGRVRWHLRDRHARKWDHFKVFRIQKVRYLKDIETLIHHIAETKGNRAKGRVPKDADLNRALREVLREYEQRIRPLKKALR